MIETQLDALAVPTRRAIFTMLLERPRSVSEIASDLPVSRPAVSQHLKVLMDGGLARVTRDGNRRVYSADLAGVAALRGWVDQMWEMAIGSFAAFARSEMESEMAQPDGREMIEPVVKTVTVPGDPGTVFDLFTARIGDWWPRATHSVGGEGAASVHMESGSGGRIYEVGVDGVIHEWGRITTWDPSERVAFTWHPGIATDQATHVEISFRDAGRGTEVTLVHDGWAARGPDWRKMRDSYDTGWDFVLGCVPGSVPSPASISS